MADDEVPPEFAIDQELAKRRQDEIEESFLHQSVLREEMSPVEAEQYAAGIGLSLEGQEWPVSFADPHWPVVYAVLWIVWRNAGRTAREWDRFRVFAGHIWRDPIQDGQLMTLQQAEELLWQALKSGSVHAQGLPHDEADVSEIPPIHWLNLEWMPNWKKISVRNFAQLEPRYRVVTVSSQEVMALWLESEQRIDNKPASARPAARSKAGRKPDPEVDRFWIEIVKATLSGAFESQSALRSHMEAWAGENDCSYDWDTIRKKIGSLYREMGWREGKPD